MDDGRRRRQRALSERGLVVARIAGIDLHLDPSWFIALVLLTVVSRSFIAPWIVEDPSTPGALVLSVFLGMAISACIVFHEAAHAAVARLYGMRVRRITLFMFGGVAQIEHEAPRPRAEFAVALAGPLASVILATVFAGISMTLNDAAALRQDALPGAWGRFALLNVMIAIFNLLPAFPMDGGRLLRSALWAGLKRRAAATRYAVYGGRAFAGLLIVYGVVTIALSAFREVGGLYTILVGVFLYNAAGTAGRVEGGDRPNAPSLPLPGIAMGEDEDLNAVTGRPRAR